MVYTATGEYAVLGVGGTRHVVPVHSLHILLEDRAVPKHWATVTRTLVEGIPGARVSTGRVLLAALVFLVPLSAWAAISY